jgi:hypothetical protein
MGIFAEAFKNLSEDYNKSMLYYKNLSENYCKYAEEFKEDPEFIEFHLDFEGYFLCFIEKIEPHGTGAIKIHGMIIGKDKPYNMYEKHVFYKHKMLEPRVLTEQEYKNRLFEYVTGKE